MYCKHCGKEIENDLKFCNHCGKILKTYRLNNIPIWIIYIIWSLGNLCLLFGQKISFANRYFYPCTSRHTAIYKNDYELMALATMGQSGYRYSGDWDSTCYDFSEFLVYVFIIPAIIFIIYRICYMLIVKTRQKYKH